MGGKGGGLCDAHYLPPHAPLYITPRESPIEVMVRAAGCDPQQSEAFGGGLTGGNLREPCTFAVRARDKWGHPCDPMSKTSPNGW